MPHGNGLHRHCVGGVLCMQEIQGMAVAETEIHQESLDPVNLPDRVLGGNLYRIGICKHVHPQGVKLLGAGDSLYPAR